MIKVQGKLPVQPMHIGTGFNAHGIRGSDAQMDPFLMADHYRMSQPTFGPHPHAGFSAVTYMFDDAETGFRNRDSLGDRSDILPGDCHWSVAGRGLVHDEVPIENGKIAHGLQLFVNLAANDKHIEPYSIHIKRGTMPVLEQPSGASVKVAFGRYNHQGQSVSVKQTMPTDVSLFDVSLKAGSEFQYTLTAGFNAFLYVVAGEVNIDGDLVTAHHAVGLGSNGGELRVHSTAASQFALFIGTPLNEPVVRHGPFAMTNREDIQSAIANYQAGRMGSIL